MSFNLSLFKETVRKETAAEKTEVKESLHIQFNGKSYASEELIKIAKDVWVFDLNQEEKDFKSVELYVKPEENVVYYVINGSVQGSFNIWFKQAGLHSFGISGEDSNGKTFHGKWRYADSQFE